MTGAPMTYEHGEELGCPTCAAGDPHVCPFLHAAQMDEPRRSRILGRIRAELAEEIVETLAASAPTPVMGAQRWTTNAELLADVFRLHAPDRAAVRVVDVTYGAGIWWRQVGEPDVRHGLAGSNPKHFDDGVDFRQLPEPDGSFDVAAYDPPYVAPGGRTTSTIGEFNNRYGLGLTPPNPAALQELINAGMTEVHRVLRPGGLALVKCKDYCWGGAYWPGAYLTLRHAGETLDMELIDRFEHLGDPGPQPIFRTRRVLERQIRAAEPAYTADALAALGGDALAALAQSYGIDPYRRQQHAARNHSTLYVLRRTRPLDHQEQLL
jgi:hypothetical protein